MLILSAHHVDRILDGAEKDVLEVVGDAYRSHAAARTSVPHSSFLRFPGNTTDRIISLAAFLGDDTPIAGTKWIASYPGNIAAGIARASATIILNSTDNGHPVAVIEASRISAWRTAASAALGAGILLGGRPSHDVSLIGAGLINAEILGFLRYTVPDLREVTVYDLDPRRALAFAERVAARHPGPAPRTVGTLTDALTDRSLISFATTASSPYADLTAASPEAVVLHVSLRDLTTPTILSAVNVVDDADHVCRALTSLHLAEQHTGDRKFIAAEIGALLGGAAVLPDGGPRIFSPFGLGVLDIAVARFVLHRAEELGLGDRIHDFLPAGA